VVFNAWVEDGGGEREGSGVSRTLLFREACCCYSFVFCSKAFLHASLSIRESETAVWCIESNQWVSSQT